MMNQLEDFFKGIRTVGWFNARIGEQSKVAHRLRWVITPDIYGNGHTDRVQCPVAALLLNQVKLV